MAQEQISPVNHGALSATGSVVVGGAGGALKAAAKTAMYVTLGFAGLGLLYGTGLLGAAFALLPAVEGAGAVSAILWTIGGGAFGLLASALATPIAAAFGAGKGAMNAKELVNQERGAAREQEVQLAAYQAQAQAMAMAASAENHRPAAKDYGFPRAGTAMNEAPSQIMAGNDNIRNDGRMDGVQLASARG